MKKIIIVLLSLFVATPQALALESKGIIEEVRGCAFDNKSGNKWARVLQFKVDGNWFGITADYYGSSSSHFDYDSNMLTSMVFMAYSQQKIVEVKATDNWSAMWAKCTGSEIGAVIHDNPGDYIRLSNLF